MRIDHCLKNLIEKLGGTAPNSIRITDLLSTICNTAFSVLPSVSASDNGKVAKVVNGAWSAVTAGGSAPLIVTLTAVEGQEGIYTASHSSTEIQSAIQDGNNIIIDGVTCSNISFTDQGESLGLLCEAYYISADENSMYCNLVSIYQNKSSIKVAATISTV